MMARLISVLLHLLFFASGAAALVYEVLWMRRFTVLLGATAPATAAALSAMFLGIGIGSAIFGACSARVRRPLLVFGLLEAGIALGALLVDPFLARAEILMTPAGDTAGPPSLVLLARMALAMTAILPPAVLMGGSLPILAQAMDHGRLGLGVLGGGLYATNTLGAAIGVLAVPAILLPVCGSAGSLRVAVGANLLVAAIALALERASRPTVAPLPARNAAAPGGGAPAAPAALRGILLAAAFFSGAVGLGLETLWSRMLALVHENSLYSFATVVAVFLSGIGAAAAVVRALLARGSRPRVIVGAGWIGAGVCVVATPTLFHALTSGLRYSGGSAGLLRHQLGIGGLAIATILPATLLAGAVLPALMEIAGGRHGRPAGRALGSLLFFNTLGAIAGPLVALFLIGPSLGLWGGIVLCGVVMLAAGEAALHAPAFHHGDHDRPARTRFVPRLLLYAAGVALLLVWRPADLPRVRLEPGQRLVALREGAFGTVAVVEEEGDRRLMLNNYYVLGGTASTGEERLQAHLPLLLHPAPRAVAFLGIGTGITASAALFHPVREVAAIELVPEVIAAARAEFRTANLGVLDDARVRVFLEDARIRLRASPGAFDVIVGDLVVPWRRGEAALYTLESFRAARRALRPGGIFCQWLPLFQLSRREFDSIAATFLDVFPETLLFKGDFRAGEPAVALVGLASGSPLDPDAIDARGRLLAGRPDPATPYLADPAGLWVYLAGRLSPEDPALAAAPRSLDGRPIVELGSPATQFAAGGAGDAIFTREPLRLYLESLRARPIAGTSLRRLDEVHLGWRDAGAAIWSASLLDLQGRRAEADALGLAGLGRLPQALQRAVRGEAKSPSDLRESSTRP